MRSSRLLSIVLASCLAASSLAVTLTDPSQLTTLKYDYVIIGGEYSLIPMVYSIC
jgi:hypothetical protein